MSTTILTGLVGSRAYGLQTEMSDEDFLSIHVAPMDEVLGLKSRSVQDNSIVTTEPDHTSHELHKALLLIMGGNSTLTELLFLPHGHYHVWLAQGELLTDSRECFLSARTVNAYRGYIQGQIKKLTLQDGTPTARAPKASRHILRLVFQLEHLVQYGSIQVRLNEWQVGFIHEFTATSTPAQIEMWAQDELENRVGKYGTHPIVTRPQPDVERINHMCLDIRKSLA